MGLRPAYGRYAFINWLRVDFCYDNPVKHLEGSIYNHGILIEVPVNTVAVWKYWLLLYYVVRSYKIFLKVRKEHFQS